MENAVKSQLQSVQFGEPQTYKNIAIVPLIAPVEFEKDAMYSAP